MKLFTVLLISALLLPNTAIDLSDRTTGNKVSDLGTFKADSKQEALKYCCKSRGGNVLVVRGDRWFSCHYAQQLANTYK